jgi:hypothetical protein
MILDIIEEIGVHRFKEGARAEENPFRPFSERWKAWARGWENGCMNHVRKAVDKKEFFKNNPTKGAQK